ncbi:MAG TPA: hypothetical protein VLA48_03070 [Nitrososphaeraceae archaeon]|nr:hypothetical protein [Nitrososphaeraceae archaeon]
MSDHKSFFLTVYDTNGVDKRSGCYPCYFSFSFYFFAAKNK